MPTDPFPQHRWLLSHCGSRQCRSRTREKVDGQSPEAPFGGLTLASPRPPSRKTFWRRRRRRGWGSSSHRNRAFGAGLSRRHETTRGSTKTVSLEKCLGRPIDGDGGYPIYPMNGPLQATPSWPKSFVAGGPLRPRGQTRLPGAAGHDLHWLHLCPSRVPPRERPPGSCGLGHSAVGRTSPASSRPSPAGRGARSPAEPSVRR
mmetsp:Transcript_13385/g.34222  ORF Transcript_13385/g.34222 Transcript_13385/m.34222 type:complete len:203 (-) Transcript_13385:1097-1705(-)